MPRPSALKPTPSERKSLDADRLPEPLISTPSCSTISRKQRSSHYPPIRPKTLKYGPYARPTNGWHRSWTFEKKSPLSAKCLRRIFASPDPVSPLQFIDQQQIHHSVRQLYQVLGVVPSRYYA